MTDWRRSGLCGVRMHSAVACVRALGGVGVRRGRPRGSQVPAEALARPLVPSFLFMVSSFERCTSPSLSRMPLTVHSLASFPPLVLVVWAISRDSHENDLTPFPSPHSIS